MENYFEELKSIVLETDMEYRNRAAIVTDVFLKNVDPDSFFEWAVINHIITDERPSVDPDYIEKHLPDDLSENTRNIIHLYIADIRNNEPLNEEETQELLNIRHRNEYIVKMVCQGYLADVLNIAVNFDGNNRLSIEENISNANLGLLSAIKKYDGINKGYDFYPYMLWWVYYEMIRTEIMTRELVISPEYIKTVKRIIEVKNTLSEKLGRVPTVEEINAEIDSVINCRKAGLHELRSMDENLISHALYDEDSPLTPREKRVLELLFDFSNDTETSLQKVAMELIVTPSTVRRIMEKIYRKLHN